MSLEWLSSSPPLRRSVIRVMRVYMRLRRATVAQAALVARRRDGRVLVTKSELGVQLPTRQLDAWTDIQIQVDAWLGELFEGAGSACLAAIHGTPGRRGVTFVYVAQLESHRMEDHQHLWLEPESAGSCLDAEDNRLLLLAENYRQTADASRQLSRPETGN